QQSDDVLLRVVVRAERRIETGWKRSAEARMTGPGGAREQQNFLLPCHAPVVIAARIGAVTNPVVEALDRLRRRVDGRRHVRIGLCKRGRSTKRKGAGNDRLRKPAHLSPPLSVGPRSSVISRFVA